MDIKRQEFSVDRCEFKYLIDLSSALELEKNIRKILPADSHSKSIGYMVRSLYFDT